MKTNFFSFTSFLSLVLCMSFMTFGCRSKVEEPSLPKSNSQKINGLEEKMHASKQLSNRMNQINVFFSQLKQVVDLYKKVSNSNSDKYTPLDFLIDLNDHLKENRVKLESKFTEAEQVIHSKIKTAFEINGCASLDATVRLESSKDDSSVQNAIYSVIPCNSEKEYHLFTFLFSEGSAQFQLQQDEWNKLFAIDGRFNQFQVQCQFNSSSESAMNNFICKDLNIKLSPMEYALVRTLSFQETGAYRLRLDAEIYENKLMKAKASLLISHNGEKSFVLRRVQDIEASTQPANESLR